MWEGEETLEIRIDFPSPILAKCVMLERAFWSRCKLSGCRLDSPLHEFVAILVWRPAMLARLLVQTENGCQRPANLHFAE